MPVFRFRVHWEEDDQIYRDIEITNGQSFSLFQEAILKAYEFDQKHAASFFVSDDHWNKGMEFSSEVAVNKKDAAVLSTKTPVSALVATPEQKFIFEYDPAKKWTFQIALIAIEKEEQLKRVYPFCLRKEGVGPAQYDIKGLEKTAMMDVEEFYDLGDEEMEEGFSNEGEADTSGLNEGF